MRRATLFGPTGLVGGHCLALLVESPIYERVTTVGRRSVQLESSKHDHRLLDFDAPNAFASLERADDVYCCLGTTIRNAGSRERFRKVDFDYVVAAGSYTKSHGAARFLVVSALGADPRSSVFYNRVKGETEEALKALGLPELHIFRPSLLLGERVEFRLGERLAAVPARAFSPLLLGPLRKYRPIEAEVVARAMLEVATTGRPGTHVYESDRIAELGRKAFR